MRQWGQLHKATKTIFVSTQFRGNSPPEWIKVSLEEQLKAYRRANNLGDVKLAFGEAAPGGDIPSSILRHIVESHLFLSIVVQESDWLVEEIAVGTVLGKPTLIAIRTDLTLDKKVKEFGRLLGSNWKRIEYEGPLNPNSACTETPWFKKLVREISDGIEAAASQQKYMNYTFRDIVGWLYEA